MNYNQYPKGVDIDGTAENEGFGFSMDLNGGGTTMIVGTRSNDDIVPQGGKARIFD